MPTGAYPALCDWGNWGSSEKDGPYFFVPIQNF